MAVAVICEFNPFHNGHGYLLETIKKNIGEPIIAIMSGSFTQRGEAAVTDKFFRAQTALENGADLVVELPVVYAVSNAVRFARCGVDIAKSFNCVNHLAFGCESDNLDDLYAAAHSTDNALVNSIIKEEMQNGNYYPRALETAVRKVLGNKAADILTSPNNILAAEYIRNLKNLKIKPYPVMRKGVDHNSFNTCEEYASASKLRSMLRNGESTGSFMPKIPNNITYPENLERVMLYRLRSMKAKDFAVLPEVNEGLENRIESAVRIHNNINDIIKEIKTKRYTYSRICRILVCAMLGITEELQNTPVDYIRVLGFTEEGSRLLKNCSFDVVTSVSSALKSGGNKARLIEKDIFASDVAALAYKTPVKMGLDYTTPIIKV